MPETSNDSSNLRLLDEGVKVLSNLDMLIRNSLSRPMLERGLANGSDSDDATLEFLFAESAAFSDTRAIVFMALSEVFNKDRVLKNIVMLDHAKKTLLRGIMKEIEVMSDLLTQALLPCRPWSHDASSPIGSWSMATRKNILNSSVGRRHSEKWVQVETKVVSSCAIL